MANPVRARKKKQILKHNRVVYLDDLLELEKCLKKLHSYSQKDDCSRHHHEMARDILTKALKKQGVR